MKILIVFSSIGGNTQLVVDYVGELLSVDHTVEIKRVEQTSPEDLDKYKLVIFASPTYNQGTLENQFFPFMKAWKADYKGEKKFAVIGLGSNDYYPEYLTESAQILKEEVESRGGVVVGMPLRITGDPLKVMEKLIPRWVEKIIADV
jgi:flavodoxin